MDKGFGEFDYWGRFASSYDEGADYVVGGDLRRDVARILAGERDLGGLLEWGCGTGYFTAQVLSAARCVTATDISEEMLAMARRRLAGQWNVTFRRADCEKSPFPPTAFDTVLMANVMNTVSDPRRVLRESHRCLRYNGLIIVIVYTDWGMGIFERLQVALRYLRRFGLPPPWGLRNYSPDELGEMVSKAGFSDVSLTVVGDGPRAVYLKAKKLVEVR
ncbi:MAG TPA: class I SAM-dependent methyltransferase [Syntrophales bacterium]|nr:class I SAM-dependent methyltransferase [Syntrophales bacterium]HOM07027.1 class I SAM-dependent methyltransferase [Syntrophales bacterium]